MYIKIYTYILKYIKIHSTLKILQNQNGDSLIGFIDLDLIRSTNAVKTTPARVQTKKPEVPSTI